jgi:hypothetical protein
MAYGAGGRMTPDECRKLFDAANGPIAVARAQLPGLPGRPALPYGYRQPQTCPGLNGSAVSQCEVMRRRCQVRPKSAPRWHRNLAGVRSPSMGEARRFGDTAS